jgi:hypothetical protein
MGIGTVIPRQQRRREAFQRLLDAMPRFEVWVTTYIDGDGETQERHHVKVIPRRIRRDMARRRAKREAHVQNEPSA